MFNSKSKSPTQESRTSLIAQASTDQNKNLNLTINSMYNNNKASSNQSQVSLERPVTETAKLIYKRYQKVLFSGVPKGKENGYFVNFANNLASLVGKSEISEAEAVTLLRTLYDNTDFLSTTPSDAQLSHDINKGKGRERAKKEVANCKVTNLDAVSSITSILGDSLRWNELKNRAERDGESIKNSNQFYLDLADEFGIDIKKDLAKDAMLKVCKNNPYHPIKDYLTQIHQESNRNITADEATENLKEFLDNIGILGDYEQIGFIKCMLSAVYRLFNPGCQVDLMLIIHGKQGQGKSTLLNILGGIGYIDIAGDPNSKDGLMEMHSGWIIEMAEVEKFTRTKEAFTTKSIITRRTDTYRPPYGAEPVENERGFILTGTTNETDVLIDPTGSRRYVIVNTTQRLDFDYVKESRDNFWLNIYALYLLNHPHWLSPEESLIQAERNEGAVVTDSRIDLVRKFISARAEITVYQLVTEVLGLDDGASGFRNAEMVVAKMLKQLGWTKSRRQIGGIRSTYWKRPKEVEAKVATPPIDELADDFSS